MNKFMIVTPSVTYALKGRDALRRAGFKAYVQRKNRQNGGGCGYGIVTTGEKDRIERILKDSSVRVIGINDY
ncbi:MAG: DUF3343 domain-containing protein [Clostridia bacterium]|nr:DUF3343 domain-containing protein [Clostridia bacterium]